MKKVLVIGKFMPPHKGHQFLIDFAKKFGQVYVVVDCLKNETMSPKERVDILKEDISNITVKYFTKHMPQDPSDFLSLFEQDFEKSKNLFWKTWKEELLNVLGFKPDIVVASMDYGQKLADIFNDDNHNCEFVVLDLDRKNINISATQIRKEPFKYFDYLLPSSKKHFVKKICFLGPEALGKSTIAQKIAVNLKSQYVSEYAETYLRSKNGVLHKEDFDVFIERQHFMEDCLIKSTNRFLICDSCALSTKVFFKYIFKEDKQFLENISQKFLNLDYDFYVLFSPKSDMLEKDFQEIHRGMLLQSEKERLSIFYDFLNEVKKQKKPYLIIPQDIKEIDKITLIENKIKEIFNYE